MTEKKIKITRKRRVKDKLFEESKIIVVKLKPSMKTGTTIVFTGEGDEGESSPPGNIKVTIMEKNNQRFQRQDSNLIYTANITLLEALTECTVKIPTIRGNTLVLRIPEVINCQYERILSNEGMPVCDKQRDTRSYGNMIVKFDIAFPVVVKDYVKDELKRLL